MVCYGNVSSLRHIFGTSFDNTEQHIFLKKTDARFQGHSGRLTVYVQTPWPQDVFTNQRGSSKSAHAWISIIFCMLNTYVITTIKMKFFYSSKAVRPQGGTLMYTLFVLKYDY